MNKQELIKAIKQCKAVFVRVSLTEHDGTWVHAVKCNLIESIYRMDDDIDFRANLRDNNYLYIGGY